MFKILKPVGMLLLVSTVPVGVLHAENLGFNTSIGSSLTIRCKVAY